MDFSSASSPSRTPPSAALPPNALPNAPCRSAPIVSVHLPQPKPRKPEENPNNIPSNASFNPTPVAARRRGANDENHRHNEGDLSPHPRSFVAAVHQMGSQTGSAPETRVRLRIAAKKPPGTCPSCQASLSNPNHTHSSRSHHPSTHSCKENEVHPQTPNRRASGVRCDGADTKDVWRTNDVIVDNDVVRSPREDETTATNPNAEIRSESPDSDVERQTTPKPFPSIDDRMHLMRLERNERFAKRRQELAEERADTVAPRPNVLLRTRRGRLCAITAGAPREEAMLQLTAPMGFEAPAKMETTRATPCQAEAEWEIDRED